MDQIQSSSRSQGFFSKHGGSLLKGFMGGCFIMMLSMFFVFAVVAAMMLGFYSSYVVTKQAKIDQKKADLVEATKLDPKPESKKESTQQSTQQQAQPQQAKKPYVENLTSPELLKSSLLNDPIFVKELATLISTTDTHATLASNVSSGKSLAIDQPTKNLMAAVELASQPKPTIKQGVFQSSKPQPAQLSRASYKQPTPIVGNSIVQYPPRYYGRQQRQRFFRRF